MVFGHIGVARLLLAMERLDLFLVTRGVQQLLMIHRRGLQSWESFSSCLGRKGTIFSYGSRSAAAYNAKARSLAMGFAQLLRAMERLDLRSQEEFSSC
eukprot:scaffold80430_cov15-Tisochrysis_lutea.AAC.1